MLDSSNHTSRSNLFALSSESSQKSNPLHRTKKHSYSSFVRKVRHLLEQEGEDLDQLYQKVQIIVKRYFRDNKIVEFGEMYNHLLCLRSNSKKMTEILSLLEHNILESGQKHKEERQYQDRADEFSLTTTTQNHSKPRDQHLENQSNPSQSRNREQDTIDHVTSSIKYQYAPLAKKDQPQQINTRTPKIIEKEPDLSPIKQSPNKRSSSYEEYVQRNRNYNEKVKKLMQELTAIKNNLPAVEDEKYSEKEIEQVQSEDQANEARDQLLVIHLDQSMEIRQQDEHIEITPQITPEPTDKRRDVQAVKIKSKSDSINQKTQDNASSQQTIGQVNPQHEPHSQPQKEEVSKPAQTGQSRRLFLLEQANLITKQLQELKSVAYLLHQQSDEKKLPQVSILSSREEISSHGKIEQPPQKKQQQKQILEAMASTISKVQLTEQNIPSFKQIAQKQRTDPQPQPMKKQQNQVFYHPMAQQVDSSVFSFSNTQYPVQRIEDRTIHEKENHSLTVPGQHQRSRSKEHDQPLEVSVVKRGYNPYFDEQFGQAQMRPIQHHQRQLSNRSRSSQRNVVVIDQGRRQQPFIHNASTPAMPTQHFPVDQRVMQNRSIRSSSRSSNKSPHLHNQPQPQLIPSRNQASIRSNFTYSSPSQNSGGWSGQRKGINLISPPPMIL